MKNRKAPEEDHITSEMLKMADETTLKAMKILLNKCLVNGKTPNTWQNAEIILLF